MNKVVEILQFHNLTSTWRDFDTNPIVFCSVEPIQPNRELPDPDALLCVLSDREP